MPAILWGTYPLFGIKLFWLPFLAWLIVLSLNAGLDACFLNLPLLPLCNWVGCHDLGTFSKTPPQ